MKLSETSIRRPVLTLMSVGALVVFGLIARQTIGMALYPDVDMPVVTASVVYEGASPRTVETEVTEVLEEVLSTISGIKSMRSETSEGVAQIFLEFELERDVDVAAQDVRDKISAIRGELPRDSEPPVIQKFDPDSSPILGIVIAGQTSIRELTIFADDVLKPRIESINGVGGVQLAGDREREIRVWLRLDDLLKHSLSAQDVIDALRQENVEFPGGRVETRQRELIVKTQGRFQRIAEFQDLIVKQTRDGVVRLREIAFVEDGVEDQRSLARLNGKPAVAMSVRRQSGTNMVAVADEVKRELEAARSSLPSGYDLLLVQDLSSFVKSSTDEAQGELIRGGGLAVLVILLFLRSFRGAFVSAITIPATIVSTYAFMLAAGFTLNTMTLLALTISVGMIIDDSIVVLENTSRHIRDGMSPIRAAIAAMNEVGFAVVATSLSIAAVFVPVAFMDGLVGRFFFEFGMTVTFAVVVSTIIALTLSPMLCGRLLQQGTTGGDQSRRLGRLDRVIENAFQSVETVYRRLLQFGLAHRLLVVAASVVIFVLSLGLLPFIGQEFAPTADEGQFSVQVEAPVGSSLLKTDEIAREVERRISVLPAIKDVYTTIGGQYEGRVTVAQIMVKMVDHDDRDLSQDDLIRLAREKLAPLSHLRLSVDPVNRMGGGGFRSAPIQYNLRGDDLTQLENLADGMTKELRGFDGFVDVNTTSQAGKPELNVVIDRDRAADLGVNVEELGEAVNALVGGREVTTFEEGGKNYDVRVRLIGDDRNQASSLKSLPLRRLDGQLTELENVAAVHNSLGPVSIERQDRRRQVTVLANLAPGKALGAAVADVERLEKAMGLPDGVTSVFTGSADMMAESFASILFCLFLAVLLTYMILAAQFESFIHPLTIMLSLPLSVGGALGALAVTGRTLNIFSMIGMVMLMGLVTKNAILLVDYTNLLRTRGMDKDSALLHAGPVRLRPILMTAFSTIAGMIPVAIGLGDGAESRAPMGACVVGGMLTSTFLTLLVVPVVYSVLDDTRGVLPALLAYVWRQGKTPTAGTPAGMSETAQATHLGATSGQGVIASSPPPIATEVAKNLVPSESEAIV